VSESIHTEIRFKSQAVVVSPAEVALLESILPEIIQAMIQAEALTEDD
jgi:hypothetical protein